MSTDVVKWQHGPVTDQDFGDRVWRAFQALPRNEHGDLPVETVVEEANGLSRGLLGKLINGKQKSCQGDTLNKLAKALRTTPNYLVSGEGKPPTLTYPELPRPLKYRDGVRIYRADYGARAETAPSVDTLALAQEAAENFAESLKLEALDVWRFFFPPIMRYKGEPWTQREMIRAARAARDRELGVDEGIPSDPEGDAVLKLQPGRQRLSEPPAFSSVPADAEGATDAIVRSLEHRSDHPRGEGSNVVNKRGRAKKSSRKHR
jgi:transcriptional regulator with XRE-family HTH domain